MNPEMQPEIDWLRRWDAQQEGYVPEREARFTAMFDALAELLPASFVALDLACGPGSISQRLLAPALPTFARLSQRVLDEQWTDAAFAARGIETAEQWWDALALEPAFVPLLTERTARFAGKQRQESPPGFDVHVAALRDAGFREVGTIWQVLSNRVLLAVR
jgi:hypothetical protein